MEDTTDDTTSETAVDAGDVPTIDGLPVKEVLELPATGRQAVVHQALGKHMRRAMRVMQSRDDTMFGNYAVFEQTVLVDGETIAAEDWDEEPWDDIQALTSVVFPNQADAPAQSVMP